MLFCRVALEMDDNFYGLFVFDDFWVAFGKVASIFPERPSSVSLYISMELNRPCVPIAACNVNASQDNLVRQIIYVYKHPSKTLLLAS